MPLRRAHQARLGRSRSRLQAREYLEWMCRSATKAASAVGARRDRATPRLHAVRTPVTARGAARCACAMRCCELDQRDLRWRADPDGRAPETGAVGDVDLGAVDLAEAGDHRLLQRATIRLNGTIWPPWVCPDSCRSTPCFAASCDLDRLVGEQHHGPAGSRSPSAAAKSGPAAERRAPVTSLTPARSSAAGASSRSLRSGPHAEPAHLVDPLLDAGVVLVVAGDEVGAVPRTQVGAAARPPRRARRRVPSTRSPTTATRSASSPLMTAHDPSGVLAAGQRAEVDVADERDAAAVHAAGQLGQRDLHPLEPRGAERRAHAVPGRCRSAVSPATIAAPAGQQQPAIRVAGPPAAPARVGGRPRPAGVAARRRCRGRPARRAASAARSGRAAAHGRPALVRRVASGAAPVGQPSTAGSPAPAASPAGRT